MRRSAAASFRFIVTVTECVVWACRVADMRSSFWHRRGRGVNEFVTPEFAGRRTDPALSRNLKPPPLGGGVFTLVKLSREVA